MLDSLIEIKTHVTVRRPGHDTVRKSFQTWAEVNHFLRTMPKTPYPRGTVAKIADWTGEHRFLLTGGGTDPVVMTKLSDQVHAVSTTPEPAAREQVKGSAGDVSGWPDPMLPSFGLSSNEYGDVLGWSDEPPNKPPSGYR